MQQDHGDHREELRALVIGLRSLYTTFLSNESVATLEVETATLAVFGYLNRRWGHVDRRRHLRKHVAVFKARDVIEVLSKKLLTSS